MINVLILIPVSTFVWSKGKKPGAVVTGLSQDSPLSLSEQILLKKFRDELALRYDLKFQSKFEQTLQKVKQSASNKSFCEKLKCILEAFSEFKGSSLFLLKNEQKLGRLTLLMIDESNNWRIKHEVCYNCGLSIEGMLKNIILRMDSHKRPEISFENIDSNKLFKSKTTTPKIFQSESFIEKPESAKNLLESNLQKKKQSKFQKAKLPLEILQFKIAQRQYNQLIWKKIKKDLMFFRQKNNQWRIGGLKARVRLQIDKLGRVTERHLLDTSGSQNFDKTILNSVDLLKLPPPSELLIRNPPYVVTIVIQP